jgi:hypothetical protein
MKRVFTSAGALAIGVLGLTTGDAQEPKIWNLRAKLRGFYDSNWATLHKSQPGKDDSFGIEVNPVGSFQQETGPTVWGVEYDYRMRFFEGRSRNKFDNQHKVSLQLENQFHDNWTLTVSDRFAIAQEPGVFEGVVTAPTRQTRADASYYRNIFNVGVKGLVTDTVGVGLDYYNQIDDNDLDNSTIGGDGSRSALLDAMQHTIDSRAFWNFTDVTELSLGYQVVVTRYSSKDFLAGSTTVATADDVFPFNRDANHHRPYVGVQHKFTDVLQALLKAGVEYVNYPNALPGTFNSSVNPWINSKFLYDFSEDGKLQFGVIHQRTATSIAVVPGNVNPSQNTETTTVFGSVDSRIYGPLSASLVIQYQDSKFDGGGASGQKEQLYNGGLTFKYDIMEGMVAEAGYALDRLDSDLASRSFSRHRGFLGLSYSY